MFCQGCGQQLHIGDEVRRVPAAPSKIEEVSFRSQQVYTRADLGTEPPLTYVTVHNNLTCILRCYNPDWSAEMYGQSSEVRYDQIREEVINEEADHIRELALEILDEILDDDEFEARNPDWRHKVAEIKQTVERRIFEYEPADEEDDEDGQIQSPF